MCWDADAPACFTKSWRIARVSHLCCECSRPILKGHRYEYSSGIWDARPDSFKTCEACVILRAHVSEEDDCSETVPFTLLLSATRESNAEEGIFDEDENQ